MEKKDKFFAWFNVIAVSLIATIGGYYLAPYYFEKKDLAVYSSVIFFIISLIINIVGILIYKYSKNKNEGLLIKILIISALIMCLASFFAIKYFLYLKYLYLAELLLGVVAMVIFSLVLYKVKEMDNVLPYLFAVLVALVMFLGKRLVGDFGIFLCGIGTLTTVIFLLYLYLSGSNGYASKLFKISLLTSTACLSWGLLQICLRRLSLEDVGINLNHSYTFLGLFLGILVPVSMKNYLNDYINLRGKAKVFIVLLISSIPLFMGLIITSTSVASYLTSYLFVFILIGFLVLDDIIEFIPSFLLTYIIVAFSPPLFNIFDDFKRLIRAGIFIALSVIVLLLYKYILKKYLTAQKI